MKVIEQKGINYKRKQIFPGESAEAVDFIMQLDKVSRLYRMGLVEVKALTEVSLDITTTLLNLIGGIDTPSSGKITVDGIELNTLNDKSLTDYRRTRVGFIFQFFNLIPTLTARENVEFAAELVRCWKWLNLRNVPTTIRVNSPAVNSSGWP
jgi:ABC-type lipoprotein export system ATPase subunit